MLSLDPSIVVTAGAAGFIDIDFKDTTGCSVKYFDSTISYSCIWFDQLHSFSNVKAYLNYLLELCSVKVLQLPLSWRAASHEDLQDAWL